MKENELRIGNYIQTANNIIGKVLSIGSEEQEFEQVYCECDESFEWFFKYNYFGIPLTDEWLLKFDAIKIGDEFIFDRFRIKYRHDYKFYYVLCKETNAYITKVEFVHEWQNVVFALNNQELILKNK